MQIVEFTRSLARPVELFDAIRASNVMVGSGGGECYVYAAYFEPASSIGAHPAGFAQLFLVVKGEGWVAGADGVRMTIGTGQGVLISPGELHSKGSDPGMTVLIVQADQLRPANAVDTDESHSS